MLLPLSAGAAVTAKHCCCDSAVGSRITAQQQLLLLQSQPSTAVEILFLTAEPKRSSSCWRCSHGWALLLRYCS
jgi:hypothetical protein